MSQHTWLSYPSPPACLCKAGRRNPVTGNCQWWHWASHLPLSDQELRNRRWDADEIKILMLMFNSAGQAQMCKAVRSWLGCLRYLHGAGRCGKRPMGHLPSLRVIDEDQAEQYRIPQTIRNTYWWRTKLKSSSQNNMQQFNWDSAQLSSLSVQSSLTCFWLFEKAPKGLKNMARAGPWTSISILPAGLSFCCFLKSALNALLTVLIRWSWDLSLSLVLKSFLHLQ